MKKSALILFVCSLIGLVGCKRQFDPINYGHESCAYCSMTIMDKRFAAEILTGKGRAIKFDDFGCLLRYVQEQHLNDPEAMIFVADYNDRNGSFLDAHKAIYLHSERLKSPMGGNYAASSTMAFATKLNETLKGELLNWDKLK
jgi:copper chaperone NosL